MYNKISKYLILLLLININSFANDNFKIAILKYRGGDWYSCINGVKNFLEQLSEKSSLVTHKEPIIADPSKSELFSYPFIIINGHGEILLNNLEKIMLKNYLQSGGFLLANDDYGMDKYFRKLMEELFPDNPLISLPVSHPIFTSYYKFNFMPKIHEHDNKPPQLLAILLNGRIAVLYVYESDIIDGWEKAEVHNISYEKREIAIKFGINIIYYSLTR